MTVQVELEVELSNQKCKEMNQYKKLQEGAGDETHS